MSFHKSVKVLWIKAKYTDTDILAIGRAYPSLLILGAGRHQFHNPFLMSYVPVQSH